MVWLKDKPSPYSTHSLSNKYSAYELKSVNYLVYAISCPKAKTTASTYS